MQHLEVSCAVQPLKWSLGVKWLMKVLYYEDGVVGVGSGTCAAGKRDTVSCGCIQHQAANTVSWLHMLPTSRGWLDGM